MCTSDIDYSKQQVESTDTRLRMWPLVDQYLLFIQTFFYTVYMDFIKLWWLLVDVFHYCKLRSAEVNPWLPAMWTNPNSFYGSKRLFDDSAIIRYGFESQTSSDLIDIQYQSILLILIIRLSLSLIFYLCIIKTDYATLQEFSMH